MIEWLPAGWLAAITSSTATAILGIVIGTYYKAKVEKAIQHNFDAKLETLRANLRKDEEELRADLKAKGEQIAALRGGALSGLANRYTALDKRRLEAIDRVWTAVVGQHLSKMAAKMAGVIDMESALNAAAKKDAEGEKFREFANVIWLAAGLDNVKAEEKPYSERPFLPPLVWALYAAYDHIISHSIAQLAAMRNGIDNNSLSNPKPILELVRSALPHQVAFINSAGVGQLTQLIDELEETLLQEIKAALHNPDADQANLQQAAAILKAADRLAEASKEAGQLPAAET